MSYIPAFTFLTQILCTRATGSSHFRCKLIAIAPSLTQKSGQIVAFAPFLKTAGSYIYFLNGVTP